MGRSRNIKPGFFTNEDLVELPFETRLLFAGLWTEADKKGRLEDRPKKIKMAIFPADAVDVDTMLEQLHKAGFICRYAVDGVRYISINAWAKHQAPHHTERASVIPPPPHEQDTVLTPCVNGEDTVNSRKRDGGNPPDSLIPDSGFTDSLIRDTPSGEPVADKPAPRNPRGSRLDPDWVLPMGWGQWALAEFPHWTPDIVRLEANKFRDHWVAKSGAAARKADWLATWRSWCRSDIAQKAHPPPSQHKETPYAAHMRERVEQAAGSMAHVIAAKTTGQRPPEPWEVAANAQRTIEATDTRTVAIGMD